MSERSRRAISGLLVKALIAAGLPAALFSLGIQAANNEARAVGPPSGAEAAYPLNHTFDGKFEALGSAPDADFESPAYDVGTPPTNYDLQAPPAEVVAVPNGNFETADFTSWGVTGSPQLASDATRGY